ncbi:hypothetical protein [Caulobacter hibisci]|uniref:Uncharacterized protein n=1 Tax=Caulobacter hibisci TaxID=2035993 RepID=A0ABS0SRZ8_9CAUL|nr:hypothetical protein [Caulobacter hibisci]MBI1682397.1 hypothetical protein [Caulobacter hibisci]
MIDSGVPLAHYRQHKADVLLDCDNCMLSRSIPLEIVIERLNARGLDGENVGIREVARYTKGPCPRCGKRAWSTRPDFPGWPGQDGLPRDWDRRQR